MSNIKAVPARKRGLHHSVHIGIHGGVDVRTVLRSQDHIFSHRWVTIFSYQWFSASAPLAHGAPLLIDLLILFNISSFLSFSFTHLLVRSFVRSFIRSFVRSFVHSFIHSLRLPHFSGYKKPCVRPYIGYS